MMEFSADPVGSADAAALDDGRRSPGFARQLAA